MVTIQPGDLQERPAGNTGLPAPGKKGGGILDTLKQINDFMKELKELGIDPKQLIGGLMPGMRQAAPPEKPVAYDRPQITDGSNQPQISGGQRVMLFIKGLQAIYGDVTAKELIQKLLADYGDKKISDFLNGGFLK
jgi:hypothetical protein